MISGRLAPTACEAAARTEMGVTAHELEHLDYDVLRLMPRQGAVEHAGAVRPPTPVEGHGLTHERLETSEFETEVHMCGWAPPLPVTRVSKGESRHWGDDGAVPRRTWGPAVGLATQLATSRGCEVSSPPAPSGRDREQRVDGPPVALTRAAGRFRWHEHSLVHQSVDLLDHGATTEPGTLHDLAARH